MAGILGGGNRTNKKTPPATALRVQTAINGQPIPFLHGQQRIANNLIWYGGFDSFPAASSGGGKGGSLSGGGKSGSSGTDYATSAALALCEGPIDAVTYLWNNKTPQTLAAQDMAAFDGYQGQPAWGYLSSSFPAEAITYSSLAYIGGHIGLGTSPELPNFNFEVRGAISGAVSEIYSIISPYTKTTTYWNLANSVTENIVIPSTPYRYEAQNAGAGNALPCILGTISSAGMQGQSWGVIDANTNQVFQKVSGTPSTGQFSIPSAYTYQFAAADEGRDVIIIDLAVAPGVSYVYQPTSTFSSGVSSITVSSGTSLAAGQLITGTGIAAGTVASSVSGTTVGLSIPTTSAESGATLTFWGNPLEQVAGSPVGGQFSVSVFYGSYGQYTFSSADNGKKVGILDIVDADPSLSLADYLTNPRYGVGFPAENVGDLTLLQEYTFANGLFISPAFVAQTSAQSYFSDFSAGLNGEFVWSTGLLTWVPYGDTNASGYGKTYTAPASAIYSLGDDDFLKNEGTSSVGVSAFTSDDPVVCVRTRPSDAYNDVKLEYLDRGNSYNPAIVEAKDDAAIDAYGLRPQDTKTLHFFCNIQSAITSAQLQLGRQMVRNQYTFTVPWYFILLDPMDVVEITDVNLGLNNQWVRILEITENQQDSTLTITAEEFMGGTGSTPLYGTQVKAGYAPNYNADPGGINTPVIFVPPIEIAATGLEIWIAATGVNNSLWGGCDVYASLDGTTYSNVGRIFAGIRQGLLTSILASNPDPDTTDTLAVNLAESDGALVSGTQADADNFTTLCYVDGELISYETATPTSANNYDLTYLRRGAYGTTIGSHAIGSQFARLDTTIFKYPINKNQIGLPIYFKFTSFNSWLAGEESLADVDPISFTVPYPPAPQQVQNFSAQQQAGVVVFGWDDLQPYDVGLKGYDIAYGVPSSAWSSKELLTEASRGTEMTNAAVPPGTWEFSIRGHDIADQLGAISTAELVVTNLSSVISMVTQEPSWLGTLDGFVEHYTGVLIPADQHTASYYAEISPPTAPTLAQSTTGSLTLGTLYCVITYVDATGETLASSESSLLVLPGNVLVVDSPATSGLATGYNVYVSSTTGTETLQNAAPVGLGVNWTMPSTGLVSGTAVPTQNSTGFQCFDQFVPTPVTSCSYIAPTVDTGYNDSLRVYSTMASALGAGQVGASAMLGLEIDVWLTGQSDPATYVPWVIGFIEMRYLNAELTYSPVAGNVSYITDFTPIVDTAPVIENSSGAVTIASGGTAITFPTPYHEDPIVTPTAITSGTALYASAANITTTGFTAHVWNSSGADVGGMINWTATGI